MINIFLWPEDWAYTEVISNCKRVWIIYWIIYWYMRWRY